jgi:hypothetical protein
MLISSAVSMVCRKHEVFGVDFSAHVVIFYKNIHSEMGTGLACGYFVLYVALSGKYQDCDCVAVNGTYKECDKVTEMS